ncbi:MAG: SUMF1/EgtB/PvdO family nonheme iron enzyme [Zavarzinella sp.]
MRSIFVVIFGLCLPLSLCSAEPKPGVERDFQIHPKLKMKFCWIPAGECQLGSVKGERDEMMKFIEMMKFTRDKGEPAWLAAEAEEKRGRMKTNGFWLGKFEVTQQEWDALMPSNRSYFRKGSIREERVVGIDTSRFPVENVSWNACQDFLKKCSLEGYEIRLPHEDEWEYAYRGGKGNKQAFYWGNELRGDKANVNGGYPFGTVEKGNFVGRPTVVGSYEEKAPHPWGLCDMSGNVIEWCHNEYDTGRALRGGDWGAIPGDCRGARRESYGPEYHYSEIGFRIAMIPVKK